MHKALELFYPKQCASCQTLVEDRGGLCPACWAATPFISGLQCDACSVPLMGEAAGGRPLCDDCMQNPRLWSQGRAALEYRDNARRMVLSLKNGRIDLAAPMAQWMTAAGNELLHPETCIVPVPLHWFRRVKRRFNQSVLLGRGIANAGDLTMVPDALLRVRRTIPQEGMTAAQRHANIADSIRPNPRRAHFIAGRDVLIIDDVMTSGATFTAATVACLDAGAKSVSVLALARVVKVR